MLKITQDDTDVVIDDGQTHLRQIVRAVWSWFAPRPSPTGTGGAIG